MNSPDQFMNCFTLKYDFIRRIFLGQFAWRCRPDGVGLTVGYTGFEEIESVFS